MIKTDPSQEFKALFVMAAVTWNLAVQGVMWLAIATLSTPYPDHAFLGGIRDAFVIAGGLAIGIVPMRVLWLLATTDLFEFGTANAEPKSLNRTPEAKHQRLG